MVTDYNGAPNDNNEPPQDAGPDDPTPRGSNSTRKGTSKYPPSADGLNGDQGSIYG